MTEHDDADRRVRIEEEDLGDPQGPDLRPTYGLGGKLDDVAARQAERYTADPRQEPEPDDAARSMTRHVHRVRETGRGVAVTLDDAGAVVEQTVGPGDELWVHVPAAGRRGWTYDVEGDESVGDVEERAEILEGTTHLPPPDATAFIVRAERRGTMTVRFEPIDDDAQVPARRLRVTVR